MQSYERIGLVALLFLVVLLVVGGLWDDGTDDAVVHAAGSEGAQSNGSVARVDEEELARQAEEAARLQRLAAARARLRSDGGTGEGPAGSPNGMPMSGQDDVEGGVKRVTTMSSGSDHRTVPVDSTRQRAQAPTAAELAGLSRPSRGSREAGEAVSLTQRGSRRRSAEEIYREERPRSDREAGSSPDRNATASAAPTQTTRPSTATPKLPTARTYVVRSGDALQKIAARELGDPSLSASIAALNGLSDPDMIRVGMVLTLPTTSARAPRTDASSSDSAGGTGTSNEVIQPLVSDVAAAAIGGTLTVRKGEPLSRALTRELGTYKRSISLVLALNPGLNPDRVFAGQVIKLPRLSDIPPAKGSKPGEGKRRSTNGENARPRLDTS
ncbi:MAG: LysM peptidoglycan-binding domain-containing protein, partial [Planctomycetota bacterium]